MASTILINTCFGGSDTSPGTDNSDITSGTLRFKCADDNTNDNNNPIPIPAAGTNYSFWKHVYLRCTVRPGSEIVNNVKFYTDGSNGYGTGVGLKVSDTFPTHTNASNAGYEVDDNSTGSTGTEMDAGTPNHSGVTGTTDAFTFSSASPLSVTIGEGSSQIDAVSEVTNFVILQMTVASTAASGELSAETLTFRYDET